MFKLSQSSYTRGGRKERFGIGEPRQRRHRFALSPEQQSVFQPGPTLGNAGCIALPLHKLCLTIVSPLASAGPSSVRTQHAVARDGEFKWITRARASDCAERPGCADLPCDRGEGRCCAERNSQHSAINSTLKSVPLMLRGNSRFRCGASMKAFIAFTSLARRDAS